MQRPWNWTRLAGQWHPATQGFWHGPISFQLSQVLVQPGPQVSYTAPCLHWVAEGREQKTGVSSRHTCEASAPTASASLTRAGGVGPPQHGHGLPGAGSAVGDEGLAVAVLMDRTLAHVRHTRPAGDTRVTSGSFDTNRARQTAFCVSAPVKRAEVDHAVTLLKLPRLQLLTLAVGAELDLDGAGAQEGRGPAQRGLLGAHLVSVHAPRLGELVHVELELAVAAHGVVALVAVVVAAEAAEAAAQVRGGHHLHEAVAVPRYLQACGKEGRR